MLFRNMRFHYYYIVQRNFCRNDFWKQYQRLLNKAFHSSADVFKYNVRKRTQNGIVMRLINFCMHPHCYPAACITPHTVSAISFDKYVRRTLSRRVHVATRAARQFVAAIMAQLYRWWLFNDLQLVGIVNRAILFSPLLLSHCRTSLFTALYASFIPYWFRYVDFKRIY